MYQAQLEMHDLRSPTIIGAQGTACTAKSDVNPGGLSIPRTAGQSGIDQTGDG